MDSSKTADKVAPRVIATPKVDAPASPTPATAEGPASPKMQSAPIRLVDGTPIAGLTTVYEQRPTQTIAPIDFAAVTPVLARTDPLRRAQEQLLGGLPNATIAAFASRYSVLPGVCNPLRVAVDTWVRGGTSPFLCAVTSAFAHLVDTGAKKAVYFDMAALDIDLGKITYGAQYGMRGLGIVTSTSDLVVIPDGMPAAGIAAVRNSRRLAGLPNAHTLSESDFKKYRGQIEREFGAVEQFMRGNDHVDQRSVKVGKALNNKLRGVEICLRVGVPVPPTMYMGLAGSFRPSTVTEFPIILKAEFSAGGSGVSKIIDGQQLMAKLAEFQPTDPIQVQRYIPGEDISFLFHAGTHGATLISSSQQEMEHGVEHVGNTIPGDRHRIQDAFAAAMRPFADYAQRVGFRGHLGIDARIGDDGKIYFIECNPRRTAVSTPTVIATQLGFPQFCHRQMVFKDQASLDKTLERFAYKSGGKEGVVITTYLGEAGKKHKSEFVFLQQGTDGTALRDSVIAWAKAQGYLYE